MVVLQLVVLLCWVGSFAVGGCYKIVIAGVHLGRCVVVGLRGGGMVLLVVEGFVFVRVLATLTFVLVVCTLAAFMAGVWSGDVRWFGSGFVGVWATVIVALFTWEAFDA